MNIARTLGLVARKTTGNCAWVAHASSTPAQKGVRGTGRGRIAKGHTRQNWTLRTRAYGARAVQRATACEFAIDAVNG